MLLLVLEPTNRCRQLGPWSRLGDPYDPTHPLILLLPFSLYLHLHAHAPIPFLVVAAGVPACSVRGIIGPRYVCGNRIDMI